MYFFTINWLSFRWPFVAGLGTCGYIFLKIGLSVTGKQTLIPIDFQCMHDYFLYGSPVSRTALEHAHDPSDC